jgi:hypothetical protein
VLRPWQGPARACAVAGIVVGALAVPSGASGAAFLAPQTVPGSETVTQTKAVVMDDGSTVAVFGDFADGRVLASVRPPGASSTFPATPEELAPASAARPRLIDVAVDDDGTVVAAWATQTQVRAAVRAPGAASFSTPTTVGSIAQGADRLAVVAGGGARAVVWLDAPTNGTGALAASRTTSTTFGLGTLLQADVHDFDADAAGDGRLGVAATSTSGPRCLAILHEWAPDGTFTGGQDVLSSAVFDRPALAMATGGRALVAMVDFVPPVSQWGVRLVRRASTSTGFGSDQTFAVADSGPVLAAADLQDDGGAVLGLLAPGSAGFVPRVARSVDGGAFVLDDGEGSAEELVAAIASGGRVVSAAASQSGMTLLGRLGTLDAPLAPPLDIAPAGEIAYGLDLELDRRGGGALAWDADAKARVALFDGEAPAVTALAVPATATAGTAVALTAQASDRLSAVEPPAWDFGDGTTASGTSVSHAWATAGTKTVTVRFTDAADNTRTETRQVAVAAAPVDGGGTGTGGTGTGGSGTGGGGTGGGGTADGTRPPLPPPPAKLAVTLPSRTTVAALVQGLRVRVTGLRPASRASATLRRGRSTLARARATASAAGVATVRVRVPRRATRGLRGKRLALRLLVVDAAGKPQALSRTIRVR